jgi:hypothetical protein
MTSSEEGGNGTANIGGTTLHKSVVNGDILCSRPRVSIPLRLSLVCVRGTLVADMLAHSPPIDRVNLNDDITAEDEEGIILALQHRDRVRRIRLRKSVAILQKLLDGEFLILDVMPQQYQRPVLGHNASLDLPRFIVLSAMHITSSSSPHPGFPHSSVQERNLICACFPSQSSTSLLPSFLQNVALARA